MAQIMTEMTVKNADTILMTNIAWNEWNNDGDD